jgi:hypothetical protein
MVSDKGDRERAAAERAGRSGQARTVRKPRKPAGHGPGRLAAGSCGSELDIRLGNPGRCRALIPGQKCSGVFRELATLVWA